jgi:hypothetical protein
VRSPPPSAASCGNSIRPAILLCEDGQPGRMAVLVPPRRVRQGSNEEGEGSRMAVRSDVAMGLYLRLTKAKAGVRRLSRCHSISPRPAVSPLAPCKPYLLLLFKSCVCLLFVLGAMDRGERRQEQYGHGKQLPTFTLDCGEIGKVRSVLYAGRVLTYIFYRSGRIGSCPLATPVLF